MYSDLLKMMNIDELTLGRFYQECIKPKEKNIPDNFSSSDALEELSKYIRKDIYKLLIKACGWSNGLFLCLWRATYPYSDQDNLKDFEAIYLNTAPESDKAFKWINDGCYVLI